MTVGAVVLAAGESRRMGAAKLALPVDGIPMLARTLAAVREAGLPALLVTGGHAEAVRAVAGGRSGAAGGSGCGRCCPGRRSSVACC